MNRSRVLAIVALMLPLPGLVWAVGPRTERLRALTQKLATAESQLNASDQQSLDHHLDSIERILRGFPSAGPTTSFSCISNGQPGSAEKFLITDTSTGTPIEKPTSLATCKQLVAVQNQDLICVSNGDPGNAEKFDVYDVGRKRKKGTYTDLKTCQTLVSRANATLVCQTNGQPGSAERFHVYNRTLDKVLGGDTSLDQCLSAIPSN
jgi:hypothetical protein